MNEATSTGAAISSPRAGYCPAHPTLTTKRLCTRCGAAMCGACAIPKQIASVVMELCVHCGGVVRPIDPLRVAAARGDEHALRALRETPFFLRPLDFLRFPFTGLAGPILIAFFGLLQGVLFTFGKHAIARGKGLAIVVTYGLLLSVVSFVIRKVSVGEDELHGPDDFNGVWEDIYEPYWRFSLTQLPFIAALIYVATFVDSPDLWSGFGMSPVPIILVAYGLAALPGAVLQAASFGGFLAIVNPLNHFRVIVAAPLQWATALGYLILIAVVYWALRYPLYSAGFLAEVLDGALNAYFSLVIARMFGLYYRDLESLRDQGAPA